MTRSGSLALDEALARYQAAASIDPKDGAIRAQAAPYPGSNLFSLASGGAIFVRDPHHRVSEEQLNGGNINGIEERDWELMRPLLQENERLFGIPVQRLLQAGGATLPPERVYRKISPRALQALQAEEAWVKAGISPQRA